jgi:uncharacterized protein (TIGR00251 family)
VKVHAEGVMVAISVSPRSSSNAVVAIDDEWVRIRLTAPPVDGKANAALTRYCAEVLGVPRSSVTIIAGASSKRKRLLVDAGLNAETIFTRLQQALSA